MTKKRKKGKKCIMSKNRRKEDWRWKEGKEA